VKTAKTNRPLPPDELEGEALLEWHRVCDELDSAGRLDKADRAVLLLYAETWAQWRAATRGVNKHGSVVKHSNGAAGRSPFYVVQRETAAQLRGLLADLGLTPTARGAGAVAAEPDDLDI
jgi:P27 family predicted phage terminase small subunit